MKFWRLNKKKPIPVSILIEELHNALNDIQRKFDDYQMKRLEQFYNTDGSPVVRRIQFSEKSSIDIPLISLVNHRLLCLSEFTVVLNADIDLINRDELKQEVRKMEQNGLSLEFTDNKKNQNTVTIRFNCGDCVKH